jgi:DNA-directed RNA polymerase subunit beta
VVVSQLARSPGVYFNDNIDFSGRILYTATLIPAEGAWLEIETDSNDVISVRVGQTRKFPLTTLLRALGAFEHARGGGYEFLSKADAKGRIAAANVVDRDTGEVLVEAGDEITAAAFKKIQSANTADEIEVLKPDMEVTTTGEILRLFSTEEEISSPTRDVVYGRRPTEDLMDPKTGKVLVKAYQKITSQELARKVEGLGLPSITFLNTNRYVEATVDAEGNIHDMDDALSDIYKTIRPGDPSTAESAKGLLSSIFYDLRRYDLARVGRYKMNKKLGLSLPLDDRPELIAKLGTAHRATRSVTQADLINIIRYIIDFSDGVHSRDDIDHLENKRVRSVGELLQNQMRLGFLRMEKVARERMTAADAENVVPQVVLSVKPISASIKSFFGSSQLSQFMDQTNPLAELTHKRRLSALGPGGLSRQSAKLEVRDVHHSHYSRVCPIETPEGPNIGLIGSLAIAGRIDEFGFLLAPYRKVVNGVVTDDIDYLTADEEDRYRLAPASSPVDSNGKLTGPTPCRHRGTYPTLPPTDIDYMDVMPMQRLHGRHAHADRLPGYGAHPVPGERRRQPRADGFQHAAPGGADPAPAEAGLRHGRGGQGGRGLRRRGAGPPGRPHHLRHGGADRHRDARPGRGRQAVPGRLPAAQHAPVQQRHLHHAEADREERPAREEGAGDRGRAEHAER